MLQCQLKSYRAHLFLKMGFPFLKFRDVPYNIFMDLIIWYSVFKETLEPTVPYLSQCHLLVQWSTDFDEKKKFHGFITLSTSIFSAVWLIKMIWNHYRNWWKIWLPDIIVNVLSFACQIDNPEQCDFKHRVNHFLVKLCAERWLQCCKNICPLLDVYIFLHICQLSNHSDHQTNF